MERSLSIEHLPVVERVEIAGGSPTVFLRPRHYRAVTSIAERLDAVLGLPVTLQVSEVADVLEWTRDVFGIDVVASASLVGLASWFARGKVALQRHFTAKEVGTVRMGPITAYGSRARSRELLE
ncbi:hypothetical protein OB955_12935 [Halobacteria archaeon AArc-m2/3/4]|uniref:Uncharacterized protein n=1 Tax=Natronoglomus mannanivorans TaxID=2979990 RepID=A0AAP3E145_9EURY|nr:hypothetical protein [Halobacteria archaeon AArc-xg1-1]MCU4973639.1 hypothetical protein [Halobacteria archaeon AArc-m2/3/4]